MNPHMTGNPAQAYMAREKSETFPSLIHAKAVVKRTQKRAIEDWNGGFRQTSINPLFPFIPS